MSHYENVPSNVPNDCNAQKAKSHSNVLRIYSRLLKCERVEDEVDERRAVAGCEMNCLRVEIWRTRGARCGFGFQLVPPRFGGGGEAGHGGVRRHAQLVAFEWRETEKIDAARRASEQL